MFIMGNPVLEIAEAINSINYASLSYNELVTLNMAFGLAEMEIRPLIKKKRVEEMSAHTREYVAIMNNYCTSKNEVISLLDKEDLKETSIFSKKPQDGEEKTSSMEDESNQDRGETILALPEHSQATTIEMVETSESAVESSNEEETPPEEEENDDEDVDEKEKEKEKEQMILASPKDITAMVTPQDFVEKAIEMAKTNPVPESIDINAPYFIRYSFELQDSLMNHNRPEGRNLSIQDLEAFRSAEKKYASLFLKRKIVISTDDCLVYNGDDDSEIIVTMYHFPDNNDNTIKQPETDCTRTEEEMKTIKNKLNYLKRAMMQANELSFSDGAVVNTPFYDRYTFRTLGARLIEPKTNARFYEDTATLSEIMSAFDTYTKFFNERYVTLSNGNCVATMSEETIWVVLFNIPGQSKKSKPTPKRRRTVKKKTDAVAKDNTTPEINPIIAKAVEMTKALQVGNGTDVNAPYFVQCELSIIGEGELIQKGKPFSKNIRGDEELAKLRKNHQRFAKTMRAINPVYTDDFTAFIWNEGKSLTVFYYNTRDKMAAA